MSNVLGRALMIVFTGLLVSIAASAQTVPPLLFTVTQPDASLKVGDAQTSLTVAESRHLLSGDTAFDPGISIEARWARDLVIRSAIGAADFAAAGQRFRSFQQFEVLRPIRSARHVQLAIGGGVRQEWGGAQTVVGRVIAGVPLGGGRLEGNGVMEKAVSTRRDRL